MLFLRHRLKAQISDQKTGSQFGNQFFFGAARITVCFTTKVTIQAGWVTCPVREFMRQYCIVVCYGLEALKRGHLNSICSNGIGCLGPGVNICFGLLEERIQFSISMFGIDNSWRRDWMETLRQTVNL